MISLTISTASPALSLARFDGDTCVANDHRVIGRGHAEALVPAIAALMAGQRPADRLFVDIGPGSFTGIRIGIAAARALGLAWGVPVTGFSGAALIAAGAFCRRADLPSVLVLLDGGRKQIIASRFARDFRSDAPRTLSPEDIGAGEVVAGATWLAPHGDHDIIDIGHPDARNVMHLPTALRGLAPTAHYLRPPDAILPL